MTIQPTVAARNATGRIAQPHGKPASEVGVGRVGVATSGVTDGVRVGLTVAVGRGVEVGPGVADGVRVGSTVAVGRGVRVGRDVAVGTGVGMYGTNDSRPRRSFRA